MRLSKKLHWDCAIGCLPLDTACHGYFIFSIAPARCNELHLCPISQSMGTCLSRVRHTETPDDNTGPTSPGLPIQEPTQSFWTYPPSPIATHVSQNTLPTYADVGKCGASPPPATVDLLYGRRPVIIGSGISGASFARTLLGIDQQRDSEGKPLTVVMLEAHETCSGASGR